MPVTLKLSLGLQRTDRDDGREDWQLTINGRPVGGVWAPASPQQAEDAFAHIVRNMLSDID